MPTALITGAGSGIGAETARRLARDGYEVVLIGRRRESLERVADDIRTNGGSALIKAADVADHAAVADAIAAIPTLDLVINNAGIIGPVASFLDADLDAWRDTVLVNLLGPVYVTRAALPALLASERGTLINVTSGAAARPIAGWSAYCASKAGFSMLTSSLWTEYGKAGLRVFELRLGPVETPMREQIRQLDPSRRNEDRSRLPTPSAIAGAIAWLGRAEADDLQGQAVSHEDIMARIRPQDPNA